MNADRPGPIGTRGKSHAARAAGFGMMAVPGRAGFRPLYLQDISRWLRSAVGKGGALNLEMDESLVGSPGFKPVREVLTLPWVGSIPTRLRQFPRCPVRARRPPSARNRDPSRGA